MVTELGRLGGAGVGSTSDVQVGRWGRNGQRAGGRTSGLSTFSAVTPKCRSRRNEVGGLGPEALL